MYQINRNWTFLRLNLISRCLEAEKEICNLNVLAWQKEYLENEDTKRHLVALASIDLAAIIPTILLNALVIFAVATRRRLRNNSTILLACLAGADLLTGFITLPIAFSLELKRLLNVGPFCPLEKTFNVIMLMVSCASLSCLVVISIERYIAVKEPLRYQDIVTKKRLRLSVVLIWAFTLLMTINEIVLTLIDSERGFYSIYLKIAYVIQSAFVVLSIIVISLSYGYIYSETRRQIKRLQTEQLPQEEVQRIKKDRKAATTLAIILIALVISYLPGTIIASVITSSDTILPPGFRCIIWSWGVTFAMLGPCVTLLFTVGEWRSYGVHFSRYYIYDNLKILSKEQKWENFHAINLKLTPAQAKLSRYVSLYLGIISRTACKPNLSLASRSSTKTKDNALYTAHVKISYSN